MLSFMSGLGMAEKVGTLVFWGASVIGLVVIFADVAIQFIKIYKNREKNEEE